MGLALIGLGIWGFSQRQSSAIIPQELLLDPKEIGTKSRYGEEILRFDSKDPRPKLLYLASNDVYFVNDELDILNKTHDIRYKVIDHIDQICTEIAEGSKAGDLKTLVLNAHGTEKTIRFSNEYLLLVNKGLLSVSFDTERSESSHPIDATCFKGLSPDAEINLSSCSTGADMNSIAATIARVAKRTVWAPRENANQFCTVFSPTIPARATFSNSLHLESKWILDRITPSLPFFISESLLIIFSQKTKKHGFMDYY